MTVSEKPVNPLSELTHTPELPQSLKPTPDTPPEEGAQKLLGVLLLLQKTWIITWELRVVVYGYTAWLLLPIVLALFAQGLPSPYGNYLLTAHDVLSFVLRLWVICAIVLFVTNILLKNIKSADDYSALGRQAWEKVIKLFIVQTFSSFFIAAGSIFFAVPGIIAWVWTAFAAPDAILSNNTVWQAFKHSRNLSRGRFFPILGRLLIANGLFALIIGGLLTTYTLAGLHGSSASFIATIQAPPDWLQTGLSLILVAMTPIITVFHLMLYIAAETTYSRHEKEADLDSKIV